MQIISDSTDFQLNKECAVAIGKFDGVHVGHRLLIEDIVKKAREDNLDSVVFTFNPSPESLFSKEPLMELTPLLEKRKVLERLGVDIMIEFPMNMETAATEPDLFIKQYLVDQMHAKYIAAGTDISYGNMGRGDAILLQQKAKEYGYDCHLIEKVMLENREISSTYIRDALQSGNMELVTKLLGVPYQVEGVVTHGKKLGRTIGMPTANVIIPEQKMMGPNGVYYARVKTKDGIYPATCNVGIKPTVTDENVLCCESFLHEYDGNLYGEYIEVELLKFVRPEMRFSSVDELKKQMMSDIASGAKYHGL